MQDMFGQEYGVGDYVAYATTYARTPVIKAGKVVEVNEDQGTVAVWKVFESSRWSREAKAKSYPNPQNIIKLDPDLIRFREDGQT